MSDHFGNSDELLEELDLKNYVIFIKKCFKNGVKKEEEDICAQDLRNLAKCLPRVSGVWYDLHKNSWEARWTEGTKSARKYYSVQKFGFHEARKLAIKTIKTKEINYIYNSISEDFSKPLKWNLNNDFLEMNHDPTINLKKKCRAKNCKIREKKIKKNPASAENHITDENHINGENPANHNSVFNKKTKFEKKNNAQGRNLRRDDCLNNFTATSIASTKNGNHETEKLQDDLKDKNKNVTITQGDTKSYSNNSDKSTIKNTCGEKNQPNRKINNTGKQQHEISKIWNSTVSNSNNDKKGIFDISSQLHIKNTTLNTCLKKNENSTCTEMVLCTYENDQCSRNTNLCSIACPSEDDITAKEKLCTLIEKVKCPSSTVSADVSINQKDMHNSVTSADSNNDQRVSYNLSDQSINDKNIKERNLLNKHTLRKKVQNCSDNNKSSVIKFSGNKILNYMLNHKKKPTSKSTIYRKQIGILKINIKQSSNKFFTKENEGICSKKNAKKKKNFLNEKNTCISENSVYIKKFKNCNNPDIFFAKNGNIETNQNYRNCDFKRRQLKGLHDNDTLLLTPHPSKETCEDNGSDANEASEEKVNALSKVDGFSKVDEFSKVDGFSKVDKFSKVDEFSKVNKMNKTEKHHDREECEQGILTGGEADIYNQGNIQNYERSTNRECKDMDILHKDAEVENSTSLSIECGDKKKDKVEKKKCSVELNLKESIHPDTLSIFKNAINLLLNDLKSKCIPHFDKQFLNIQEIIDNHISYVNSMLNENILITYVHLFDICVSNNILPSQMDQKVQTVFCNALIAFHILLFNFQKDKKNEGAC
ncbi:transcription factor with AP2 domain(s) [Plasmodium gonderi]|uniref:Transcription factor with AP2 domain(S) n=1 Tax=Plasmodium gonderi TaxID=77519 RepID=A0A1Y1JR40_PLAGO|nr:transcription factor with AP2 domain(s) [Plasmodium gonderi]GAW82943.1 transcription factor with AP2 domain(s) [Plasmodium gonderi]